MSRIGKLPIAIPQGVTIKVDQQTITVKGPKGELTMTFKPVVNITVDGEKVLVGRVDEEKATRAMHGLARAKIANMIEGVTKGYSRSLEVKGVGYRIAVSGKKVTLNLGFSHPIEYKLPDKIEIELDKENKSLFTVKGIDKQVVGEVAANIRSYRKPEPYKGKGIRYVGEYVPMKQGKAAASAK